MCIWLIFPWFESVEPEGTQNNFVLAESICLAEGYWDTLIPSWDGLGAGLLMAVKTILPLVAFTTFSTIERLLVCMLRLMAFEMIF